MAKPIAPFVNVALLYDDSGYVECQERPGRAVGEAPVGLMGRQVAGREFLNAYLTYGCWSELTAVVYNQANANSLLQYFQRHPAARIHERRLRLVPMAAFQEGFLPTPPAPLLYTPCPPDPAFAWARHHSAPGAFALSGVTHTLSTAAAVRVLCELLTAPYEPYDALICTSTAVVRMVRSVTDAYADYLRDRHGMAPALRIGLETIPLGVDPHRFRPPTAEERSARRAALKIADDEVAVLFVGRFAPHAKAHPYPMFHGIAQAARETGRRAHLILSGWAAHPAVPQAFLDAAGTFAAGIPVSVVDGMDPDWRFGVWHAADVFTSLSDSIQETFGLVVVEAMASGLPVVVSDWDGYRDLVVDGGTGWLVPTCMVRGATSEATVRLILGANDYDAFLGECNQAVAVDPAAAANAYARLFEDAALRRRMGDAGRRTVLERFTWAGVIKAYEDLWRWQESERRAWLARRPPSPPRPGGPPCFPAPEVAFGRYPSRMLADDDRLKTVAGAESHLGRIVSLPLTNYAADRRVADEAVLRTLLATTADARSIAELIDQLSRQGIPQSRGRATLAWLLKYGLMRWE
ncbi:MAG TPA: glycosyltransferase family 4 protein [Pirellulales bacterium]|nr:glycosyltransferase family 4 protein [Pirellulales bacterium]